MEEVGTFVNPGAVASASWLASRTGKPGVVIVDTRYTVEIDPDGRFRSVPGHAAYLEGHIPGAIFVNLDTMKDPSDPTRIIDAETFADLMTDIGIGDDDEVVVYDTEGGTWAARLWWALRHYGHPKVRILDGGLASWTAAGLATESGETTRQPSHFTSVTVAELRVDIGEMLDAVGSLDTVIVDALPEPFYTGQVPLYPHLRRGHIPGAVNIAAPTQIDPRTWELLPQSELEALWAPTLEGTQRIITYCGGGVYGAFDLFVLHLLGHDAALYDGSWEEWGARDDTPVETGPDTTRST